MPTTLISAGPAFDMIQNVVYALPSLRCLLFCDTAAATFLQSTSLNMTPAVALTPDANEQCEVAGVFIQCTSGNVRVSLKTIQ
jgi:hypothetical protein